MASMKYNDKILDIISTILKPETRVVALEGSIRSSKTASITSQALYLAICNSPEKYHCICGRDLDVIKKNLIEMPIVGLLANHPDVKWVRGKVGSVHLEFIHNDQVKEISLVSYSNISSWKKVLGGTLGVIFIDEADIADPVFIREAKGRQASVDNPKLIFTSNGNLPTHTIYNEWYNYCKPIGKVPPSILSLMNKFQAEHGVKEGWYYFHCTMNDNPIMTQDKIDEASSYYPIGSYYYKIKILGERGVPDGLVYQIFVDDMDHYIINNLENENIIQIRMGVDFGGNGSQHAFVAVGVCRNYKKIIPLKSKRIDAKNTDTEYLKNEFVKFVQELIDTYNMPIVCRCDSAEQILIKDLKMAVIKNKLKCEIANAMKIEINERIRLVQMLFAQDRIKLLRAETKSLQTALAGALWDSKATQKVVRLDDGTSDIDSLDAFEYAIEPIRNDLTRLQYI